MGAANPAATGKVTTGFSFPYIGKYAVSSGTISYTSVQELARGVDVDVQPDTPDDNQFWANNQQAESGPTRFRSGTVNLTVDGLLTSSLKVIRGLPEAGTDGWIAVGDSENVPYVGIGFLQRWMSGGVEGWTPIILVKTKFNIPPETMATETADGIDWQTQALTANIYRSDNANHDWKWIGGDYDSEDSAKTALLTKFGVSVNG